VSSETPDHLGFAYEINKNGTVYIQRFSKRVTTLRGSKAISFCEKIQTLSVDQQQQYMARLTGNYKRGNEKPQKL
jgi:hypothetical protein